MAILAGYDLKPAQSKIADELVNVPRLAEWLNVEPHVLRYGDHVAQRVRAKQKRWDEGIGYQEREVFEAFLKLPVAQRKVVREVILAFVKADKAG